MKTNGGAENDYMLDVRNLRKYFPVYSKGVLRHGRWTKSVRWMISAFASRAGRPWGSWGESGSGKTTASRAILRAIRPTGGARSGLRAIAWGG